MEQVVRISIEQTQQKLIDGETKLVDIRDAQSFAGGHIQGAFHLTNASLQRFIAENDFATPVIVCCYHGISSLQAGQYLIHQGFAQVYSMDGGFEAWRKSLPFVSSPAD